MRWQHLLLCPLLVACARHGQTEPSAEQAATMYLSIHNDGDRDAARVLWGPREEVFEELTQWFREQVGPCTSFSPMHVTDSLHARFVFECRDGQLEIEFRIDAETGVANYVLVGARGVEPPAHVVRTAEQIVAIANGEPASTPELAANLPPEVFDAELDAIATQGPCKVDRVHLGNARGGRFILECAEGPLTMLVDTTPGGQVRRFGAKAGAADHWRTQG